MSPKHDNVETIFAGAVGLSSPERERYLARTCAHDAALRERVEKLLRALDRAGGFLTQAEPVAAGLGPSATESGGASATVTLPVTEKAGDRIGRYKLLQQIGEGGCGVVYMAEQEEPVRRRVALKVIKLGMDTKQVIARFEAERQALALMDHSNIAKVLDAGATETGRPYFVMELVRGIKITDYCDDNNLSTRDRLDLFIQVCHAIQHAHQKGIIHRDIKPSNILVTVNDGVPVPKVIDFGIAKATTQQRLTDKTLFTAFEQFIGTPAYMSPEQAVMTSLDIDTRSDIYALGVLLYELLTGHTPFDPKTLLAAGLDEMRRIIREQEPVRPSTRLTQELVAADGRPKSPGPEAATSAEEIRASSRRLLRAKELIHLLRGDLDWIVMKCLEKDRTRRYETADGLAADIQRHLEHEPVLARPPSVAYQVAKFVRRNRATVTTAVLITAALVLGTMVSTWQAVRASRLRVIAEENKQRADRGWAAETEQRQVAEAHEAEAQRSLYAAKMNLAQQAWEENHPERVRQLLEESSRFPDRGFEWFHWQRQIHRHLKTLRGHIGTVTGVAFAPDGRRVLTGSGDQTAKLWDADTGQELATLDQQREVAVEVPTPNGIQAVAFSTAGSWIALANVDNHTTLWDARNVTRILTLRGHTGPVRSVAFSPDDQRLVTGSLDDTARIWDRVTGRELNALSNHTADVCSAVFSPDGRLILTASHDSTSRIWDAATGQELVTLRGHRLGVNHAGFSPKGDRVVTAGNDRTVRVWEASSGQTLLTLEGHKSTVESAAFSPDGTQIATAAFDGTAKIWDAATGRELRTLMGHTAPVVSVAFSPDGRRIGTASIDQTARIWDAALPPESFALPGHESNVSSVATSSDGTRIVSGGWDGTARIWDAGNGKERHRLIGHRDRIWSVAISSDGRWVATGGQDQIVVVWDSARGRSTRILKGHTAGIRAVAFMSGGTQIVTGSEDCTARIWDTASGRLIRTLNGHTGPIMAVAVSPDGKWIVTGSIDQTGKVWDAGTGTARSTLAVRKGGGAAEGFSRRWADARGVVWNEPQKGGVFAAGVSPDSQRIATAHANGTGVVWDLNTGEMILTLRGHAGVVQAIAFSPDGRRVVTGSWDGTARVWDARSGDQLLSLKERGNPIRSVAFSPDGRRIIAGGAPGIPQVWEAASHEEVQAWQEEERVGFDHVAARKRERAAAIAAQRRLRASDPGAIKHWLLLAPIPFETAMSGTAALNAAQIAEENLVRPRAGQSVRIGRRELFWRELQLDDYMIDFNEVLGGEWTQAGVAYAVCYIHSRREQGELQLRVGHDDQAKVYLNGKKIYDHPHPRMYVADLGVAPDVTLMSGLNVLVFKVVNAGWDWQGSLRLTDPAGNPVEGIEVTLNPDE